MPVTNASSFNYKCFINSLLNVDDSLLPFGIYQCFHCTCNKRFPFEVSYSLIFINRAFDQNDICLKSSNLQNYPRLCALIALSKQGSCHKRESLLKCFI